MQAGFVLFLLFTPDIFMDVYDKIISFRELYKGLRKSAKGVMWKDSVAGYSMDGMRNTMKLRKSLLEGTYRISEYQKFIIHEPKTRVIVATRIKDRQFQRSLCDNALTPMITKGFIYDNGACLKGKGVDFAMNRLDAHLHRYYRKHGSDGWVLRCDISHYFPETPHEVAKAALRKRITDDRVYQAAADIIDSFGDGKGIGLGSQVSQLTELAVLDDLDHYIKERMRIKYYIRYMDDFILIHNDRDVLEKCLKEIRSRIQALGLELNRKTQIFPLRHGISFLQWRFILTKSGKVVRRAGKRSIVKQRRRLKKLAGKIMNNEMPVEKLYESFQSWRGHIRRGNTFKLERQMTELFDKYNNEVIKHDREQRFGTGKGKAAPHGCGGKAGKGNCSA